MRRFVLGAVVPLALAAGAALAEAEGIAVADIKAQVFLQGSGRWSEDISAAKKAFRNLPRPGNELGEPAEAMLVTLVFSGPKNSEGSRTLARDMALVTVKQTKGDTTRTLLYRAFGGFRFGDSGVAHRAFLLDEATCAPLEIEVKVGRSRKIETLDLACDAPAVAETGADATASTKGKAKAKRR
jgi:hypothetical protein